MVMRNLLVLFLGFFIGLSGIAQTEQEIACHYTVDGRLVLEKEVNGAGLVGIDTGGLASGIYSVRLVKDVNSQSRLLMVS